MTGWIRGQNDSPVAPPGFELNNPWKVRSDAGGRASKAIRDRDADWLCDVARETICIDVSENSNIDAGRKYVIGHKGEK